MLKTKYFIILLLLSLMAMKPTPPHTLYVIGDSTVKNGHGDGRDGLWGWGSMLATLFDTTQLKIVNRALGGTSSRTYLTKGLWQGVLDKLQKGDYLLMQFGHNDGGPLDDTARARGTLKGIGDESRAVYNPITKQQEVVHTYGWYLAKFINEAKAKGVHVLVCSPIPRNQWKGNQIVRSVNSYAQWAEQVAKKENVDFIDLNKRIADDYDSIGKDVVQTYFLTDHTHTNRAGAEKNASIVIAAIRELPQNKLKSYLK